MQSTYKKKKGSPFNPTMGDRIFDTINAIIMILLCIVTLYPMYFVIVASFTKNSYLVAHPGAVFWPVSSISKENPILAILLYKIAHDI